MSPPKYTDKAGEKGFEPGRDSQVASPSQCSNPLGHRAPEDI